MAAIDRFMRSYWRFAEDRPPTRDRPTAEPADKPVEEKPDDKPAVEEKPDEKPADEEPSDKPADEEPSDKPAVEEKPVEDIDPADVAAEDTAEKVVTRQEAPIPSIDFLFDRMALFEKVDEGDSLYAHQRAAVDFVRSDPRRSKLICYAMGTGKTFIAADYAVNHFKGKVIYMGPKSLHPVFAHHITAIGGDMREVLSMTSEKRKIFRYSTVTSEASNVFEQIRAQVEPVLGPIEDDYQSDIPRTDILPTIDDNGEPIGRSPSIVLIMDECHLFSARVATKLSMIHYLEDAGRIAETKGNQAYKLYRFLCREPRIQVIAMTGTPVKTHPFNFVPIANIVRREFTGRDGKRSLAFPEVFGRFHEAYVQPIIDAIADQSEEKKGGADGPIDLTDQSEVSITPQIQRKLETFVVRLRGLIMWYEAPKGLPNVPIPVVESEEYVNAPMSKHQWKIYRQMEDEEQRLERMMRKPSKGPGVPRVDEMSIFRAFTRQASNFAFPEDLYSGRTHSAAEMLGMMDDEDFRLDNIGEYSCKAEKILESIFEMDDRIHGVFSSFVHGAGIAVIERALRAEGWLSLEDVVKDKTVTFDELESILASTSTSKGKRATKEGKEGKSKEGPKRCIFMTLTGDTSPQMKDRMIEIFNNPANASKNIIRVVLYSGAAAHGLTFNSGRVIHFFEPQWDDVEESQARDRFVRLGSARFLPVLHRKVKIYYYIAVPPSTTAAEIETADQHLLGVSARKAAVNGWFIEWIKAAATNCKLMFQAEGRRDAIMLSKKITPPDRIFFQCVSCSGRYNKSYLLQEMTDSQCSSEGIMDKPKKGIKFEGYLLDPERGLAWTKDGELVSNAVQLRALWHRWIKST